ALVAVQVLKIEPLAARAGDIGAGSARRLNLDHVGAPIGELAYRGRSGAGVGQVEHGIARQRQGSDTHDGFPPIAGRLQRWRNFRPSLGPTSRTVGKSGNGRGPAIRV